MLTSVTLMIDCLKEILRFATILVAVLQDAMCVGGWTGEQSINREKPVMVRE